MSERLAELLATRFGEAVEVPAGTDGIDALEGMAARGSCRHFIDAPVEPGMIRLLAAVALASPTKSDLQQRDIVLVRDHALKARLKGLVADQAWTAGIPELLIFCGNNRRQRQVHAWRGYPFVNDHLDAFFNAAVDAGIAMQAFITAAEAAGLGCCPISAIRNEAAVVSAALELPDHVFPVAGLAVGWPKFPVPRVSLRLPLGATLHVDRYDETGIEDRVAAYDARRAAAQPMASQRDEARFGSAETYTWSEDKARQYAAPERAGFGAFVRAKGFKLD